MHLGNGLGIFIASVFSDLRITLVAAPPIIFFLSASFFLHCLSLLGPQNDLLAAPPIIFLFKRQWLCEEMY
jgi:hypothetical protein